MSDFKVVDPHQIETHSEAHRKAFESLLARVKKAFERKDSDQQKRAQMTAKLGSRVHRGYPDPWRRAR